MQTRVLLVDDDERVAEVTAEHLQRNGDEFTVAVTTRPREVVTEVADESVDCVVSDYEMPGMNGLELLDVIRERYPDLPFVLYTGKGSEEIASEAISRGVSDYLRKRAGSGQYDLLANRIENAVERRAAARRANRVVDGLESATEGIGILDDDGRYVYVNEAYADVYDYEVDDLEGEHWSLLYPPEEVERFQSDVLPIVAETGSWSGRATGQRADGTTVPERLSLTHRAGGGHVCVVSDVSDEAARRRAMTRYETIVETIEDPVWCTDETGRLTYANEATRERATGELTGRTATEVLEDEGVVDADFVDTFRQAIDAVLDDERDRARFDVTLSGGPDDDERIVDVLVVPATSDGEVVGAVGVNRDVTDRRRREARIEQQNERLQTLLDNLPVVLFVLDADGVFTLSRGSGLSAVGVDPGEVEGQSIFDVYGTHPDIPDQARRALDGERLHVTNEVAGHVFDTWYRPVTDESGEVERVVGVAADVTDLESGA